MRRVTFTATALLLTAALGTAKDEIEPSVTYATSWDEAVAEAKLLNVPIVVHSHGFYWGPCWSVHGSVLQNKKYIKFAYENTVEVISLSRLDEGIQKEDRKAATYEGDDGKKYLVEFPNLTVDQMNGLNRSKAASYNNTGRIPYTAIVNPHTQEEMVNLKGGYSAGKLMDAVEEQKKALEKQYGKSVSRKDLDKIRDEEKDIKEEIAEGKLTRALSDVEKLAKKYDEPKALAEVVGKIQADVLEACGKKLDELEALIGRGEAKDAARELGPLSRALKGTSLEERAAALYEQAKSTS